MLCIGVWTAAADSTKVTLVRTPHGGIQPQAAVDRQGVVHSELERDVITFARGLDGGGSVAADNQGNVYVFWHAPKPGNTHGEAGRGVFVARSADDGATFNSEKLASTEPTGACACCGMKAFADSEGNVFALYRTAFQMVNRDETLLFSRNHGEDFEIAYSHRWKIATCPMSSALHSHKTVPLTPHLFAVVSFP